MGPWGCTEPGQEATESCGQIMQEQAVAGTLFFTVIVLHSGNTHSLGGCRTEGASPQAKDPSEHWSTLKVGQGPLGPVHSLKVP